MSNKSKKERDDDDTTRYGTNTPSTSADSDDSKTTSKSSITPEGKYSAGYETEDSKTSTTSQGKDATKERDTGRITTSEDKRDDEERYNWSDQTRAERKEGMSDENRDNRYGSQQQTSAQYGSGRQQQYMGQTAGQYEDWQARQPRSYQRQYEDRGDMNQPYGGYQDNARQQAGYGGPYGTDDKYSSNYGNYEGYGSHPYQQTQRGFRGASVPYSPPYAQQRDSDWRRRERDQYGYGGDVNYGFPQQDFRNQRNEYASEYGRGSGDWSDQGQGYSDYDRDRNWNDNESWGRRSGAYLRPPERNYSQGRNQGRQYFGDDYIPRYSNDWSRGFEDTYERGYDEDPWYRTRRGDNDNRASWQDSDRMRWRSERNERYSEDDDYNRNRYDDERQPEYQREAGTPRYDEDYRYSSSSDRNRGAGMAGDRNRRYDRDDDSRRRQRYNR